MGCGCGKNRAKGKVVGTASSRTAVYQLLDSSGNVISEFTNLSEARKAASQTSSRMRVTSKSATDVVT